MLISFSLSLLPFKYYKQLKSDLWMLHIINNLNSTLKWWGSDFAPSKDSVVQNKYAKNSNQNVNNKDDFIYR